MFSASSVLADVPLFLLQTALFPDGLLPLKVFEARYMDMVRRCLREKTPFGVCLLKSGNEIAQPGEPAVPETIGCLAEIELCDVETVGVLLIHTRGTRRFRLLSHRTEADGLLVGMAEPLGDDAPLEDSVHLAKFGACAEVLERIIAALRTHDPERLPFAEPFRLDDPSWVSNRLAEILPVTPRARQKLMELQDAGVRIELVHHYMQKHQLL
ncbi:LON peptidase substrate-binding domain-containing protein [Paraburkholderia bonniea]|uniref:LON peptidase substrate-binding domain-containing protein n=1 Tax=Paraburkholderia bonniea TaxID=2152891 RepID=UPI002573E69C|nr:LON peptidase substrate-binding domain-containing protein [Paraburkholderia bonniea]WJF91456.1 LON peptidase substrate-binding domain-containing protein [Paraburkholderia bonniea]WJF94775.1 LON peptidase substrate-binding domain-containing protein [Paraburkholderia bonniea]